MEFETWDSPFEEGTMYRGEPINGHLQNRLAQTLK
jgi:hypothetical protein